MINVAKNGDDLCLYMVEYRVKVNKKLPKAKY